MSKTIFMARNLCLICLLYLFQVVIDLLTSSINLHVPSFPFNQYDAIVLESAEVDTLVIVLEAVDLDNNANVSFLIEKMFIFFVFGQLDYKIINICALS